MVLTFILLSIGRDQNRLALNETLAAQLWDVSEAAVAKWAKPL